MTTLNQTKNKLRVPDDIAEFVKSVHPNLKRKIKSALKLILSNPNAGKELRAELKGLKSFRVSCFRIIYRVSSKHIIEVIAIGPRKTIYELTYRIARKESSKCARKQ